MPEPSASIAWTKFGLAPDIILVAAHARQTQNERTTPLVKGYEEKQWTWD